MKFLYSLMIFVFAFSSSFAGEEIRKVLNPIEVREESSYARSVPKEIEGLQWNRWTSKNFIVLATNDTYASYLNQHLELVKTWTLGRWGLFDVDFSSPCKFICVDDPVLFEKLFKINQTKVEVRRGDNGEIKQTVIFLLANKAPSSTVPVPLTEVCLAEFGRKYDTDFSWWTYRGMSLLNGSLGQIRESIASVKNLLDSDQKMFFSQALLKATKEDYAKMTEEKKRVFDLSSIVFCLLIRKEFGQDRFHHMMKESTIDAEKALIDATGFKSYSDFDKTFKRYMGDLSNDVINDKTPDHYLQIYEPKKD